MSCLCPKECLYDKNLNHSREKMCTWSDKRRDKGMYRKIDS